MTVAVVRRAWGSKSQNAQLATQAQAMGIKLVQAASLEAVRAMLQRVWASVRAMQAYV